jgi:hypothetical protein
VVIGGIDAGWHNCIRKTKCWPELVVGQQHFQDIYPSSVKNKTWKEERLKLMWKCLRSSSLTLDWFTHPLLTKSWSVLRHQEPTNTLQTA